VVGFALAVLLAALHPIGPAELPSELLIRRGDTLSLAKDCVWILIEPVRHSYGNMIPGGAPAGLGVDPLGYVSRTLGTDEHLIVPDEGVFYLGTSLPDSLPRDTAWFVEPPNLEFSGRMVQIAVRTDDSYIGFLMELINTPFIMAPRLTPGGSHQADSRLGTDCAALAVYGRRRMGYRVEYLGPSGILRYLDSLESGQFSPGSPSGIELYMNGDGKAMPVGAGGLSPGDILHFGSQVSVFYRDCGVSGLLDADDLVIQSWFDGPHICVLRENGFFPRPLRVYRWRE